MNCPKLKTIVLHLVNDMRTVIRMTMSVFMQMMIWIVIHDIDPDVAELLKKRLGEKLNPEKIKEIVAKQILRIILI